MLSITTVTCLASVVLQKERALLSTRGDPVPAEDVMMLPHTPGSQKWSQNDALKGPCPSVLWGARTSIASGTQEP